MMKFTRWLLLAFMGFVGTMNAQKEKIIALDSTLQHPYEFSSIAFKSDTLLLMSENCYKIFMLNSDSGELYKEVNVEYSEEQDVEAIRVYKDYLFFADEVDNSLLYYDFKTDKVHKIENVAQEHDQNLNHDFGIEGIAIHTEKKILYALKEYGKRGMAELFCYQIDDENGIDLTFIDKMDIKVKNGFRFSDITISNGASSLVLLRTKFNDYELDVLELNKDTGLPRKSNFDYKDFKTFDISNIINPHFDEGYSTNIEGLALDDKYVYLVSDNYSGRENDCENRGNEQKTLLVRLRLFY